MLQCDSRVFECDVAGCRRKGHVSESKIAIGGYINLDKRRSMRTEDNYEAMLKFWMATIYMAYQSMKHYANRQLSSYLLLSLIHRARF